MSSRQIIDLRGKDVSEKKSLSLSFTKRKKRTTLRARRTRTRIFFGFCILLLCSGGIYGLHLLSYAPQFTINSVSVDGTRAIPAENIKQYVEDALGSEKSFFSVRNIFLYPRVSLEQSLASTFPRIASVAVHRDSLLADALQVSIEERSPFARWCDSLDEANCFVLDQQGFIFATSSPDLPASSYFFTGDLPVSSSTPIRQHFLSGDFTEVVALLRALIAAEFNPLSVSVVSGEDYSVRLSDGFFVKGSFGEDPQTIVKNLQLVLGSNALKGKKTQLEYIDLRFGDRVYYKFRGELQSTQP